MGSFTARHRQQCLLQLLQQADCELSAQELHQRLKAEKPCSGLATVYRGLKLLQQAGAVRCRKLPNGETVYAPLERDDHRLICVQCGETQTLHHCPLGAGGLGLSSVLMQGFRPFFHTFEIHGLCRRCQGDDEASCGV